MHNRRSFLRRSLFAPLLSVPISEALAHWHTPKPGRLPVCIATWGNNKPATAAAWQILANNGYALDAAEAGARIPEADPNDTSVGFGGYPDRDGHVTLDACIMDERGNAGSVCFLEGIMHPISVARRVMEKTPHVMLAGEGALQFALQEGFIQENLLTQQAKEALAAWQVKSEYKPVINVERHDTIGILALDSRQRLCGGCTTSGQAFKMRGRVGDSPVIGAGLFVDGQVGAASCSGLGELTLKTLGCFLVVEEMRRGASPQKAAEKAIRRIVQKYPELTQKAQIGFIALDVRGRHGAFSIHPGFNYSLATQAANEQYEAPSLLG
ncbi:MAG: N(4)-(beta-N-acetylglucosaminyl)-L-asparaginase [Saprospiraceae bacterium]|nr:N(4)-(beta-N-acetylglucosaminyl)-L-asparaginase [Saprospiraceae bacterium]